MDTLAKRNPYPTQARVDESTLKRFYLALATLIALTLLLRLGITVFDEPEPGLAVRLMRLFSYFTIQSNLLLLVMAVMVARAPGAESVGARVVRLDALAAITLAGTVYFVVLRPDADNEGLSVVTNFMMHYFAPVAAIGLWLVVGPWHRYPAADLLRALVWPVAWIVYTLIHGEISGWYPYGFADVAAKGYGRVAVNMAACALVFLALIAAVRAVDRWRLRGAPVETG